MKLEQPVQLNGVIQRFKGNGRKLGYPTANLTTTTDLGDGVYFGFADLLDWEHHPAIIFVGVPTTVGDTERRVEAYLLNIPDQDYYDEPLALEIIEFHRNNKTFNSIDELLVAMHEDETVARLWFDANA